MLMHKCFAIEPIDTFPYLKSQHFSNSFFLHGCLFVTIWLLYLYCTNRVLNVCGQKLNDSDLHIFLPIPS
uniref:Uncharacterized protein n=1 Tax=Rhizophora mucronata TaxID=61149 RepID=A0A2P2N015_RHIMU